MQYGLTMENEKLILDKAKEKNDGCYRFRGVAYRVKNGTVTHFAVKGEVLERAFGFNVIIGVCSTSDEQAQKELKAI